MHGWPLLFPAGLVLLLLALLSWRQPRAIFCSAQWSHAVTNLNEDAETFYARLFKLLETRLGTRPLPFHSLSIAPCRLWATRTVLGGDALYLQARYRHLTYYIYACPVPGGLYVSAWLFSSMAGWEEHPWLRWLLAWRLSRLTLFGFDAMEMFHGTVHGAVLDLLDDYARERGLPPLDDLARRPVLHGFYAKSKNPPPLPVMPAPGTAPAPASPASSSPSPARLPFDPPSNGRATGKEKAP